MSILTQTQVESIPAEIRELSSWVCWQENGEGRPPIQATYEHKGRHVWAKCNDQSTWTSFEMARRYLQRYLQDEEPACGLSFALTAGDGLVGIDLDKCRNAGNKQINKWAAAIIERFGSYTEVSPSGAGIRIFIHGKLPPSGRHKDKIEVYDRKKFLTVTGRKIKSHGAGENIENRSAELLAWHQEVFGDQSTKKSAGHLVVSDSPTINERKLDRLFKSKPKAKKLYEGDSHGYASQSEADLALANLAIWAKWSAQETCDLLVAARLNAGEEPKHVSYYGLTISKAKSKSAPTAPSSTPNKQVCKVSGSDPWGDPVLVDDPGDLPGFPVESLPTPIGNWASAVSENSQTPVDLAAMMALAATAAAIAKKAAIQPYRDNSDYTEPANAFFCVPLASGNRKTFVVEQARKPFEVFLKRFKKEHGQEFAIKRQELMALVKRKAVLTDQLAKAKDDKEYKKIKTELQGCLKKIGGINTYTPRFFADDVTPERLTVLMSQHDGRIAILTDEAGCFDHFAGIYNKRPNLDVYLHGHSGGTILRDRQLDGEQTYVESAALTIGISPQSQAIEGMSNKDRLQGRGLLARFLWSFPKSTLGCRDWEPQPIPNGVKLPYSLMIQRLLAWHPKTPARIKLSKQAFSLWVEAARGFEAQLGEGGSLSFPGIQEWAGKLPGAIARIALLLHYSYANRKTDLQARAMQQAIAIGEYLIPHARTAFRVLRTDPATDSARVLQNWIVKRAEFTRSQAQQNHKGRFPNVADVDKPLQILVDRQICRPKPTEAGGPGRPSCWYETNPVITSEPET